MDILDGEGIIGDHMTFKDTAPFSVKFELFGIDTMNFMTHSGSYFFIAAGLFGYSLFLKLINWLATCCPQRRCARIVGMKVYENSLLLTCWYS
jgi:hypothetical protein